MINVGKKSKFWIVSLVKEYVSVVWTNEWFSANAENEAVELSMLYIYKIVDKSTKF